jgi:agmatinase
MTKTTRNSAFMGATRSRTPTGFHAAIFGAPHGTPYPRIDNRVHATAPNAFRLALQADSEWLNHWDFDLGGPLLGDGTCRIADLGNLPTKTKDGRGNRKLIEAQTRKILEAGAVPLMFGGDDSTPIPFISGFSGNSPLTILQIDAHIDWRDERYGERFGFSSTMRRASEQTHVWRIVQVGTRGLGSAREAEVRDAKQWGAHIFTSRQLHHDGLKDVLETIPPDSDCLITLDCDALDTSQMPAVAYPSPGGLRYLQVIDLISGVAAKARIAGFTMVEFVPKKDRDGTSAYTAARIAANVIGHIARQI